MKKDEGKRFVFATGIDIHKEMYDNRKSKVQVKFSAQIGQGAKRLQWEPYGTGCLEKVNMLS